MKKFVIVTVAMLLVLSIAAMAFAAAAPKSFDKKQAPGVKATDAVSGQEFAIAETSPFSEYEGRFFYFQNAANKVLFDKEPAKFAK